MDHVTLHEVLVTAADRRVLWVFCFSSDVPCDAVMQLPNAMEAVVIAKVRIRSNDVAEEVF